MGIGKQVTLDNCNYSVSKIQVLEDGVAQHARPIIVLDRDKIYKKLIDGNIMNEKKNPCSKVNISLVSDFNIIT